MRDSQQSLAWNFPMVNNRVIHLVILEVRATIIIKNENKVILTGVERRSLCSISEHVTRCVRYQLLSRLQGKLESLLRISIGCWSNGPLITHSKPTRSVDSKRLWV
ncbi:MAG: hypothetical protein [Cressdnaviricota sp.]|nr:MAG: hypothetical protein [Cressdnaviricota sp.]